MQNLWIVYGFPLYQVTNASITIKPKAKYRFNSAAMLLFFMQQKITSTEVAYYSKIYYLATFQVPKSSGASVAPTSQVCMSAM
jgi:hypothetical protein